MNKFKAYNDTNTNSAWVLTLTNGNPRSQLQRYHLSIVFTPPPPCDSKHLASAFPTTCKTQLIPVLPTTILSPPTVATTGTINAISTTSTTSTLNASTIITAATSSSTPATGACGSHARRSNGSSSHDACRSTSIARCFSRYSGSR